MNPISTEDLRRKQRMNPISTENLSKELEMFDTDAKEFLDALENLTHSFADELRKRAIGEINMEPGVSYMGIENNDNTGYEDYVTSCITFPRDITYLPYNIIKKAKKYHEATDYHKVVIPSVFAHKEIMDSKFSLPRGVLYGYTAYVCAHAVAHIYQKMDRILYAQEGSITNVDGSDYRRFIQRGADSMALRLLMNENAAQRNISCSNNIKKIYCELNIDALKMVLTEKYYNGLDINSYELGEPADLIEQIIRDDILRGSYPEVMNIIFKYQNGYVNFHNPGSLNRFTQFKAGKCIDVGGLAWLARIYCSKWEHYTLRVQVGNAKPVLRNYNGRVDDAADAPYSMEYTNDYIGWARDPDSCTLDVYFDEPIIYPALPTVGKPIRFLN